MTRSLAPSGSSAVALLDRGHARRWRRCGTSSGTPPARRRSPRADGAAADDHARADPSTPRPAGRVARRTTRGDAGRRGRRPGRGLARFVHLGRRRIGQSVAAGRPDRGRCGRVADGRLPGDVPVTDWAATRRRPGTSTARRGPLGSGHAAPIAFAAPGARHLVRPGRRHGSATTSGRRPTTGRSPSDDRAHRHGTLRGPMPTSTRRRLPTPRRLCRARGRRRGLHRPVGLGRGRRRAGGPHRARRAGQRHAGSSAGTRGGGEPIPIKLPKGDVAWVATGLQDVLAAVRADGTSATSDPVQLGKSLTWRNVDAKDPSGKPPAGPSYFAAWEPDGGRYAMLAGDLSRATASGSCSSTRRRLDARSRSRSTARRGRATGLDRRRPARRRHRRRRRAHRDDRRRRRPATRPRDRAATGSSRPRPTASGSRRWPSQGAPIVIRDMAGWLAGDGSSVASIEPPERLDDRDHVRPRYAGSATRDRLGRQGRIGHARRPRRPLRLAPHRKPDDRLGQGRSRRLAPLTANQEPRIACAGRCRRRRRPSTGASAPQGA